MDKHQSRIQTRSSSAMAGTRTGRWGEVSAAGLAFLPFRISSLALLLLFVSVCLAHDSLPKRELKTKEQFAKYRDEAWAHFNKRCKEDAREAVNRVVENVDAIFLIRLRLRPSERDLSDQYWMGDPYGYSSYEVNHPVATFLFDRSGRSISGQSLTPIKGYRYVEVSNPDYQEGAKLERFLRYTLKSVQVFNRVTKKPETRIQPVPIGARSLVSRYGITWEDISTRVDREYWVAGGKLTVLDLQTQEIVGERIGYVIDPQFGNDHQGRRPWLAIGFVPDAFCPKFENRFDRNKEFVAKVLKASAGKDSGR